MLHIKYVNNETKYMFQPYDVTREQCTDRPLPVHSKKRVKNPYVEELVEKLMDVALDFDHSKYKVSWNETKLREDLYKWVIRHSS